MDDFAEILGDLIDDKGLSLRALGKETKVSASLYSSYLRGRIPTVAVAVRIANYFDCSLDYLFGLSNKIKPYFFKDYDVSLFLPRYRALLEENNITHWKFCQNLRLNESVIRKWEKGQEPRFERLIIIAENLGASLDYLVGRTDKK